MNRPAPMTKPVSSELIAPCAFSLRPQDSQDEAGRNGRADVSLHALQIDVELAADQMDERHPRESEHHHHSGHHAAEADQLALSRIRLDLLIEVESDQGRSRIEHRTHRSHQCRQQGCDHHAHEASRKQINDECGISDVAIQALRRGDRT